MQPFAGTSRIGLVVSVRLDSETLLCILAFLRETISRKGAKRELTQSARFES
jgi:hypothetical protein